MLHVQFADIRQVLTAQDGVGTPLVIVQEDISQGPVTLVPVMVDDVIVTLLKELVVQVEDRRLLLRS